MADLYLELDGGNLNKLEVDDITNNGVQALSKQPTRQSAFGEGGLSADDLKKRFDKLPTLLAKKINAIISALGDGGDNINVKLGEKSITLKTLVNNFAEKIEKGTFADTMKVDAGNEKSSLQNVITSLLKDISDIDTVIENLKSDFENGTFAESMQASYGGELKSVEYIINSLLNSISGINTVIETLERDFEDGTFADTMKVDVKEQKPSLQVVIDYLLDRVSTLVECTNTLEYAINTETTERKNGDKLSLELGFDRYSQRLRVSIKNGITGEVITNGSIAIPDREIKQLVSPECESTSAYNSVFNITASDGGTYVDGYRIYVAYEVNGTKKVAILGIEKPAADETLTFDLSLLASREGLKLSELFEQGVENTFSVTAVGLGMLESEPREIRWVAWLPTEEVVYKDGVAVGISEDVGEDYLGEGALVIACELIGGTKITEIGEKAFEGKSGYTSLWLPPTVKTVSKYAFYNCSGITRVNAPSLAEYCGIDFMNSGAAPLYNGINEEEKADAKADLYCDGKKVEGALEIPAGVKKIGARAFYYLTTITSLKIPDSVVSLGASAFCGCLKLKSADIGGGVTELPSGLFYNCPELEEVSLTDGLLTIGNEAFSTCESLRLFEIPESVTAIGDKAFLNDSNIKSLIIPKSVTSIGANAFAGADANLEELSLPFVGRGPYEESNYFLGSIFGKSAASTSCCQMLNKLTLTPSDNGCVINNGALAGAKNLKALEIEGGIVYVNEKAFCGYYYYATNSAVLSSIKYLKINNTNFVTYQNAFYDTGIKAFCIGDVKAYCESCLNSSSSDGGEPAQYPYNSPLNSNSEAFLADEDGNPLSELYIPDGTKSINTHAFYRPWSHRDENIKKISLPGSLESIGGRGLMGQRGVTEIEFRGSEDEAEDLTLGFYALVNMPSLKNLYLPDRVKSIGRYALHSNSYNKLRINTTGCEISDDALVKSTINELYLTCSETEAYNKGYPWGATVNAVHYNSTVTAKEF